MDYLAVIHSVLEQNTKENATKILAEFFMAWDNPTGSTILNYAWVSKKGNDTINLELIGKDLKLSIPFSMQAFMEFCQVTNYVAAQVKENFEISEI